jgi:hypothetical protein
MLVDLPPLEEVGNVVDVVVAVVMDKDVHINLDDPTTLLLYKAMDLV